MSDALLEHRGCLAEVPADVAGFVANLVVREAERGHAGERVLAVSASVAFLGRRRAVVAEAVGLDHEAELWPEEVDFEAVDPLFAEGEGRPAEAAIGRK